jgi:hypothetical protein
MRREDESDSLGGANVRSVASRGLDGVCTASDVLRLAWVSVALIPVAFVAAMLLGESLLMLQGDESSQPDIPLGVVLRAGVPAVLLLIAPTAAAIWFGLRARRLGLAAGLTPASIGAVVAVTSILLNGLPLLLRS